MNTKRLVTDAMLVAMCFLLGLVKVDLWTIRLTLEGLPILVAAALFGPVDGLIVGLLGGFLGQLVGPYGLTATTPLWILPPGARGLIVGLYAQRKRFRMTLRQTVMIVVISALAVTTLNTLVWYVDSQIYGGSYLMFRWGTLGRFGAGIGMAILFSLVLPPILKVLRKEVLSRGANGK